MLIVGSYIFHNWKSDIDREKQSQGEFEDCMKVWNKLLSLYQSLDFLTNVMLIKKQAISKNLKQLKQEEPNKRTRRCFNVV